MLALRTPKAYATREDSVLTDLWTKMVQDSLNEYAYAAEIAGLSYNLYASSDGSGVSLVVGGFEHKLPALLRKVVEAMVNTEQFTEEQFARFKEKVMANYGNWDKEQPYSHAFYGTTYLLQSTRWHVHAKLRAARGLTLEDLKAFVPAALGRSTLDMFFHGNTTPAEALEMADLLEATLAPSAAQLAAANADGAGGTSCLRRPHAGLQLAEQPTGRRAVQLRPRTRYLHVLPALDPLNENSAVEVYFMVGRESPRVSALLGLLAHVAKEPAFDVLRTQRQLGYIVFTGIRRECGVLGLQVLVQSTKADPLVLDDYIEEFLQSTLRAHIEGMSDEAFESNVQALTEKTLEADKTLYAEGSRWFKEISAGKFQFRRAGELARELRALSRSQLLVFFDAYVRSGAAERRKLTVGVCSAAHAEPLLGLGGAEETGAVAPHGYAASGEERTVWVSDPDALKRSHSLWPSCD